MTSAHLVNSTQRWPRSVGHSGSIAAENYCFFLTARKILNVQLCRSGDGRYSCRAAREARQFGNITFASMARRDVIDATEEVSSSSLGRSYKLTATTTTTLVS